MVVIATGLNEVIAGAEPRYEPVYVYLVAVAAVTWLDGVLAGALAAVFSAAFYAMLFMPRESSWTMTRLTPAGAMLLTVFVVGAIRAFARRNLRREPPQIFTATAQPLLAAPVEDHTEEVLAAIDELRAEFRVAMGEVAAASRAPAPPLAPAPDLTNALAEAQAALKDGDRRAQASAADAALARLEVDHVRRELERAQLETNYAREETASLAGRIAELELSVHESERTKLDLASERDHAAKLALRVEELESQLGNAVRDRDERDALLVDRDRLDTELRAERARTIAARAELGALHERIKELELLRDRIESELRSESMRTEAAHAETEAVQAELDRERANFDQKLDKIATHLASSHESETRSLEAKVTELQAMVDSERAQFDEKLNKIVTHLASDHESDLGQAVAEREEARAEARMHKATITLMQKELETLRAHAQDRAPVRRPRVLIAYPDADIRANAKASLDRSGYEVLTAADGLEALRMAVSELPAVVIADAIMPKMNGRELCQLLKSQDKTSHIRVILLLRSIDAEPQGELVPDEVLRKPVPPETLRGTLAALLGSPS